MAQQPYVPQAASKTSPLSLRENRSKSSYSSPACVPKPWRANNRPGDISGKGNPQETGFGSQGPDQGYVLKLAREFSSRIICGPSENKADIMAGCVSVALKRASLAGRAPISEDIYVALLVFGFIFENTPQELVAFRQKLFRGAGLSHNQQAAVQKIADSVLSDVVVKTPDQIQDLQRSDWRLALQVVPGG